MGAKCSFVDKFGFDEGLWKFRKSAIFVIAEVKMDQLGALNFGGVFKFRTAFEVFCFL